MSHLAIFLKTLWLQIGNELVFTAILFGCVWLLCKALPKSWPALRHGLWCLVVLRFLLPLNHWQPFEFLDHFSQSKSLWVPQVLPALPLVISEQARLPSYTDALANWEVWIWWSWSVAYVLMVLVLMGRFVYLRRRVQGWINQSKAPSDNHLSMLVHAWRNRLKVKRTVRLCVGGHTQAPFTKGLFKPVIYLPQKLVDEHFEALDAVIAHEMAHIRRLDDVWLRCLAMVRILFFYVPWLRWCLRAVEEEREKSCDALVIQSGAMSPARYGKSLLSVLKLRVEGPPFTPALSGRNRGLAQRLRMLSNYRRKPIRFRFHLMPLLVLAGMLLPLATAKNPTLPIAEENNTWLMPLPQARVSSAFGPRIHPFKGKKVWHKGVDLVAPRGTLITVPADGVVLTASKTFEAGANYGTVVVLAHSNDLVTVYAHLDSFFVKEGQKVEAGAALGTVGMTGQTTAPHLHLEIWQRGEMVNPKRFLPLPE